MLSYRLYNTCELLGLTDRQMPGTAQGHTPGAPWPLSMPLQSEDYVGFKRVRSAISHGIVLFPLIFRDFWL